MRFGQGIIKFSGVPIGSIFSSTGSGEVEGGISGEPEYGARRSVFFWKETAAGGGTEEVDVEVLQVVGAIVREEGSSRATLAAV